MSVNRADETSVAVNVIGTTLLMLLLLPILKESARRWETLPHLCVTGSAYYTYARFRERKADNSFDALSKPRNRPMHERLVFNPPYVPPTTCRSTRRPCIFQIFMLLTSPSHKVSDHKTPSISRRQGNCFANKGI